jgi:hypothetical protein
MEDNLKKQIEDIMKQIDEQKDDNDSTGTKNIVHVYILDASTQESKPGEQVKKAPLHNRVWLIALCLLIGCIGLLFSLFPLINTTASTITSTAGASMTTQQITLGPTGVVLVLTLLAFLVSFLILEKRQN